jgi:hypothetical protein
MGSGSTCPKPMPTGPRVPRTSSRGQAPIYHSFLARYQRGPASTHWTHAAQRQYDQLTRSGSLPPSRLPTRPRPCPRPRRQHRAAALRPRCRAWHLATSPLLATDLPPGPRACSNVCPVISAAAASATGPGPATAPTNGPCDLARPYIRVALTFSTAPAPPYWLQQPTLQPAPWLRL